MSLFARFSGASDTIGIDIGSHSIKVVQVSPMRGGYVLARAGSTPTPPEAIKQGVVDDRLAVAEAIHDLLRRLGVSGSLSVAAVAGPTVVVRQVQLPAMAENQLRKSIYWEARNYISFPVEDSLLEFEILGTHTADGAPQMDVMLVATPRDLVDSRVEALEQAGLDPIAVELEPFALMRGTVELLLGGTHSEETVALVNIGATYTHITIVSRGAFILSRSVTTAGNSFTEAIASAMSIELAQAEDVKESEVRIVMNELDRASLSPMGQEASRALEPVLEELIREIRRSFAFYDYQRVPGGTNPGADAVMRVILSGGTSKMPGLAQYLTDQLGIPAQPADLFNTGSLVLPEGAGDLHAQGPLLATALGLALREPMLLRDKEGRR